MRIIFLASVAALPILLNAPAYASEEADTLAEAITQGKANFGLRYRLETVDQSGFSEEATASTLRTSLKYATKSYRGFSGVVEFDNVTNIGDDDYNSTGNGKTQFPVIADPEGTEVNQAYIAYTGFDKTTLLAGRAAHNMNNQRFVGTVGWRQNDQSFDMAAIINKPSEDLTFTGAYIWNVNRIFGDNHALGDLDTNTFIFDGKYTGFRYGNITAYGLMIDLNDAPVFGLSSKTFGVRFDGSHKMEVSNLTALYEAEFATQSDYEDSPLDYSAQYYQLAAGLKSNGLTGKFGVELLGSDDGVSSFQTPLATLHKFNGWADKFLATPAGGLEDFYGSLSYVIDMDGPFKGLKFDAVYHDFSADTGGDYGSEIDLQVSKRFAKHYFASVKFADYNADGHATDTQKLWVSLGAKF